MKKELRVKVKKLALVYRTDWEYMPDSEEAGSVLTDVFLDMAAENRKRYNKIWKKQEMAFLEVLPEREESRRELSGALLVRASDQENGKWLKEGTEAHMLGEQGDEIRLRTVYPIQLTSATLQYAVYCKGLGAWLSYEAEGEKQSPISLFRPVGRQLSRPVFQWYFQGLCDGKEDFRFEVEFHDKVRPASVLRGSWTVSDGETLFPADWRRAETGFFLEGRTPDFAKNLDGKLYEIRLEIPPWEEPEEEWLDALWGGITLVQEEETQMPDFCLTDFGAGEGVKVLPFGDSPEEASCCYLSCDRVLAGKGGEITLRFRESYLTEERLPQPRSKELEKWYKKYPWLKMAESVREWQAEDTLWEYFNGNMWRTLADSEAWHTGCRREEGEKSYRWKRPLDMEPCVVEGEEHFYIRLRLRKADNAYAPYYRKVIPVLEEIRFSGEKRRMSAVKQVLPDCREGTGEKMYLGFDRQVTSDNCWYTGEGSCSFGREMIRGKGVRFGREAFWVELTEKRNESFSSFLPNFVPVQAVKEEGEEDSGSGMRDASDAVGRQIASGTVFSFDDLPEASLDTRNMGELTALCPFEMCNEEAEPPVLSERQAGEHYFAHFGRLLTPMDMELMLQDRYPLLRVDSCLFRKSEHTLEVRLNYPDLLKNKKSSRRIKKLRNEIMDKLPEIENWLERILSTEGPLWLQDCRVNCCMEDTGNAGTNIAG